MRTVWCAGLGWAGLRWGQLVGLKVRRAAAATGPTPTLPRLRGGGGSEGGPRGPRPSGGRRWQPPCMLSPRSFYSTRYCTPTPCNSSHFAEPRMKRIPAYLKIIKGGGGGEPAKCRRAVASLPVDGSGRKLATGCGLPVPGYAAAARLSSLYLSQFRIVPPARAQRGSAWRSNASSPRARGANAGVRRRRAGRVNAGRGGARVVNSSVRLASALSRYARGVISLLSLH